MDPSIISTLFVARTILKPVVTVLQYDMIPGCFCTSIFAKGMTICNKNEFVQSRFSDGFP